VAELKENMIKLLVWAVENGRKSVEDIKDPDYKSEVENRLQQ
jgi:hypothetical protein